MSIEDHDDYLKISISKLVLRFSNLVLMALLSLNGWFVNRLVLSIDENIKNVNSHSIKLVELDEKMNDSKRQINQLRRAMDRLIQNRQ